MLFNTFQELDLQRLEFIKSLFVRYHTLEAEHCSRVQAVTERRVAQVIDVSPQEDVNLFCADPLSHISMENGATTSSSRARRTVSRDSSSLPGASTPQRTMTDASSSGGGSGLKSKVGTIFRKKNRQSLFLGGGGKKKNSGSSSPLRSESPNLTSTYSDLPAPVLDHPQQLSPLIANGQFESSPNRSSQLSRETQQEQPPLRSVEESDNSSPAQEEPKRFEPDETSSSMAKAETTSPSLPPPTPSKTRDDDDPFNRTASLAGSSSAADDAAILNVASQLRAQPTIRSRQRGRRENRNSSYIMSPESGHDESSNLSPFESGKTVQQEQQQQQPPRSAESGYESSADPFMLQSSRGSGRAVPVSSTGLASDTMSVRSAASSSMGGGAIVHPDLSGPGLQASIIESVSAIITNGEPVKAMVVGECAVLNNAPVTSDNDKALCALILPSGISLKRGVANPEVACERESNGAGVQKFELSLKAAQRKCVAFKYQYNVGDGAAAAEFLPLIITSRVKHEPGQSSIILEISGNKRFRARGGQINLCDVSVTLRMDGSALVPVSCQSKPAGEFVRRTGTIVWRLGTLAVSPYSKTMHLARFIFDNSEAKSTGTPLIEAKWRTQQDEGISFGSLEVEQLHGFQPVPVQGLSRALQSQRYFAT